MQEAEACNGCSAFFTGRSSFNITVASFPYIHLNLTLSSTTALYSILKWRTSDNLGYEHTSSFVLNMT